MYISFNQVYIFLIFDFIVLLRKLSLESISFEFIPRV